MITRISIVILALTLITVGEESGEDEKTVYQISPVFNEIPGTLLWERSIHTKPEGGQWSQTSFTIGYKAESKNGDLMKIIPILTLPALKEDNYDIKVDNGVLLITEKRSQKEVLRMHIANLVPALLTKTPEAKKEEQNKPEMATPKKPSD